MPLDQINAVLAALPVFLSLLDTGKTTVLRLRGFLAAEGATPAQLADMDARLSAAIAAREAERV